jgi:hypothetical protein
MRWAWTRGEDAIEALDPEPLEVVELDADGRLVGPPPARPHVAPHEVADRPSRRDPTGLAGIWEALAHS